MYNRRFTPGRITHLADNEIFVFGSNLSGHHGGDAARVAMDKFGAVCSRSSQRYNMSRIQRQVYGNCTTPTP